MGCGGSKIDDLPLVIRCRARKELIKSAIDHRYDLSSSHVAYFQSLKDVGDALSRFVDEEVVVSFTPSPVLKLSSEDSKTGSSISCSHSIGDNQESDSDSHLSRSSDSESDSNSSSGNHFHNVDDDGVEGNERSPPVFPQFNHNQPYGIYSAPPPYQFHSTPPYESGYVPYGGVFHYIGNPYFHYMKKSAPASVTVVHKEERGFQRTGQLPDSSQYNPNLHANGSFHGFSLTESLPPEEIEPTKTPSPPPPPPPPKVSGFDFLNLFDEYEDGYKSYGYGYGYGSAVNNPDTSEGIPDTEYESEEVKLDRKRTKNGKFVQKENISSQSSGTIRNQFPSQSGSDPNGDSKSNYNYMKASASGTEKRFYKDERGFQERNPTQVFNEIKNEFEIAFGFGKQLSVILEADKVPYRPNSSALKVALSRILYPLLSSLHPKPSQNSRKLARAYHLDALKATSLSSTLEKLYILETNLYNQVKDEEVLRLKNDTLWMKLHKLDSRNAEFSKIDDVRASIQRKETKLDICLKTIDATSHEIQKVRDEQLQPQLTELIHGFMNMWRFIEICHGKQCEAINATRNWKVKNNIGPQSNATRVLTDGIPNWCKCFEDWIRAQKSFVDSLNDWLQEFIDNDGNIPFPPDTPPIFVTCKYWVQGIDRISEKQVETVKEIRNFALSLSVLMYHQDDENKQRRQVNQLVIDLGLLRKKLKEARSSHKRAVNSLHVSTSQCVKAGLIPLFKALEDFSCNALQALEKIRGLLGVGKYPMSLALGLFL